MEKDSPSTPSVAELAGRFKGHILPMPNDELRLRRKPPCSLKFQNQTGVNEDSKSPPTPTAPKVKLRNSAAIEKLQANLALSPTALLPSPRSPEVKLQPAPLSPTPPCSPLSPLIPLSPTKRLSHPPSEEEDPVSFESPPESIPLLSINKTRARLSFKRRPPTRQHRRSAGEEAEMLGSDSSQSELSSTKKSEDEDQVFPSPAQEEDGEHLSGLKGDNQKDGNCEKTNVETPKGDSDNKEGPNQEEEEETQRLEALDKEEQLSDEVEEKEADEEEEEREEEERDTPQDIPQDKNDTM